MFLRFDFTILKLQKDGESEKHDEKMKQNQPKIRRKTGKKIGERKILKESNRGI